MFGDDELYFGSIPAHLCAVRGRSVNYIHGNYTRDLIRNSDGKAIKTLARKDPIPAVGPGEEISPVVVPCVPSLDVVTTEISVDVSAWPIALQSPLIKTGEFSVAEPKAVVSGCRSACVKIENEWFRLKGCGNNADGFISKTSEMVIEIGKPKQKTRQIRGSAFVHTALMENYNGAVLSQALEPHGILSANIPMGYYLYDDERQHPIPLTSEHFQPACIVEKTRGDRRLGTHILAGISLLLNELIDYDQIDSEKLLSCFPATRKSQIAGGLGVQVTTASEIFSNLQLESSMMLLTQCATVAEYDAAVSVFRETIAIARQGILSESSIPNDDEIRKILEDTISSRLFTEDDAVSALCLKEGISQSDFYNWLHSSGHGDDCTVASALWKILIHWAVEPPPQKPLPVISIHDLSDARGYILPEKTPNKDQLPIQFFNDMRTNVVGSKACDPRWQEKWSNACTELAHHLDSLRNTKSVLAYLFSRLGFECGSFLSSLHNVCNVSWGTYQDAMCHPAQWHCNAHINNMVILSPASSNVQSYLGYLDLDMAFDAKSYVEIDPKKGVERLGEVGKDPDTFKNTLLVFEHVNFMECLAGSDSNMGVPVIAQEHIERYSDSLKTAMSYLYDIMMQGYLRGYTKDANFFAEAFNQEMHNAGLNIIQLAIIKQADFVA